MPDRYGDNDPIEPVPDDIWAAEARAMAIVNCDMCDDEGYRGVYVCDHIDHAAETEHGRALVKAELERIRNKRLAGER
jgi:hypothetical protein